jgi:peroxiredoxin
MSDDNHAFVFFAWAKNKRKQENVKLHTEY